MNVRSTFTSVASIALCTLFALSWPGCSAFSGSDAPTPSTSPLDAGAGANAAADGGTTPDDSIDAGPGLDPVGDLDSGTGTGTADAAAPACTPMAPTHVVTVTSDNHAVLCTSANATQLSALSASDGTWVGLDWAYGGAASTIDGVNVTSCVGVQFSAPISTALIRVKSGAKACNAACNGECLKGDTAQFFTGTSVSALKTASHGAAPAGTYKTYSVKSSSPTTTVVAVCRPGFAAAADDIFVDSILGCK